MLMPPKTPRPTKLTLTRRTGTTPSKAAPRPRSTKSSSGPHDIANPEGFVAILVPHWVASRRELTPAAKLLYGYLLQRYRDDIKCAFPSQRDIGEHLGCGPRWVRELVKELEAGGFVHVARRKLQLRTWKRASLQTCYSFLKHPGMDNAKRTRRRNEQDHIEATLREQEA